MASDWRDQALLAGDWSWRREGPLSVARFGLPAGTTQLSLTCDPARRVVTLRHEGAHGSDEPMTVTTTSTRRVLTARPSGTQPNSAEVELPATDRLLDAIAFSRGRFMVELPAHDPAIVPVRAELARVIEDCR